MGVAASTKYAYDRLKKKLGRNPTAGETKALHTRVKAYFSTPGRETEMPAGWQPEGQSAAKKGKAVPQRKKPERRSIWPGTTEGAQKISPPKRGRRRITPQPKPRPGLKPSIGGRTEKPMQPRYRKYRPGKRVGPGAGPGRRVGPTPRLRKYKKPRGRRIS